MSKVMKNYGTSLSRRQYLIRSGGVLSAALVLGGGFLWFKRRKEKTPYELGRDKILEYQKISSPKIIDLLGAANFDRCCAAMHKAYDGFADKLPALKGNRNISTFYANAPFMLSLYRVLLGEFSLPRNDALSHLSQITNYKVKKDFENRAAMRFLMSRTAESSFFRKLVLKGFEWENEEYGWATEFPQSDAYIAVNVTRCGLVKWFKEQGVPEIAPVACEGDFIWAEYMKGLELRRTKTLARGDELCDFRYVKK